MGAIIATPVTVALTLVSARPSDYIFWCKWIISYVYIKLHGRSVKKRFDYYDMEAINDPIKVNFLPHPEEGELESPMTESHLLDNADEVFFYGVNSKSECLITRVARSNNGEAEAWIYLKLSNGKIYQLNETTGFQQSCCDKRAFTCGGLQIQYLSPMRKWRIFFNGLLREMSEEDGNSGKMVHVKFGLIWRASSDAYDFMSDVNSKALVRSLAKSKWNGFLPPLEKLHKALNFYCQCGIIVGNITIEGNDDDHFLYVFGERMRILADTSFAKGTEFFHVLGQISKNGRFVHVTEVSIANVVENLTFGFVCQPSGDIQVIVDSHVPLENSLDKEKEESNIQAKFHTGGDCFELKGNLVGTQSQFQSMKGWEGRLTIDLLDFELNSQKGSGVVLNGKIMRPSKRNITKESTSYDIPSVVPLVVHFADKICQNSDITGGKGSSLGKLTMLSKDFQNFVVPNGIVVTTTAYEKFLTKEVLKEIKNLENTLYNGETEDAKGACQRVMAEVIKSNVPEELTEAIVTNLQKAFSEKKHGHKFAVRSSATGEDTEQMSAAGQMETFLGVSGTEEILSAVKKCWASQFSFIAVQYKRQNGQIINSPMAVVIQQMVSCDVAGVLFTCDPLTGNPTKMSITANYGLGESVVSGSEEPDTIEIGRSQDDKLVIKNKTIGSKNRRIIIKDDGGTLVQEVSEKEKAACCLTDDMSLRLANLAVKIEKSYRSHRDIEWGFWNNNLYIFQSRPVTSGTGETDFEIEHEMDAPLRVENDYFTVCNVGEVMPGAMSTLGMDLSMKFFHLVFQRRHSVAWQSESRCKYFPRGIVNMYSHVMFYAIDLFQQHDKSAVSEASSVGLFGRVIDDDEMFEMARERHEEQNKKKSKRIELSKLLYRTLFIAEKELKKAQRMYSGFHIPFEKCKTSQECWNMLMYSCTDICEAFVSHMACSESSSILNMIIFVALRNAQGELNADVYSDFAQLVTNTSEVESADVPAAIENLASCIEADMKPEDFKKMNTVDAIHWLQTSSSTSGIKYRDFLMKHGHRCLKEFEVRSNTWSTNPSTLILLLQNLVGSVKKNKSVKKSDDIKKLISELKCPLGWKSRLLLRFVIPRSRRAVQNRELTKSILIRGIDVWRKGYCRLSKLMVAEGRIPDRDLLYFMTMEEIKELFITRSPKTISKANHRRRRYPTLDEYIFPEIMKGFPMPINSDNSPIVVNDDSFSMKGVPVSQGVAKGFARVALNLDEASHLQPGEILVTYSTDIGWSPYFPILGGVVTELGGLISHGAVVSREYGIPCIAALHGATRQFQTGDYVVLDGYKGILQKITKPEKV